MEKATLEPGESIRFGCDECSQEWELCYEPKAKGGKGKGIKPATFVPHCPCCGKECVRDE